MLRFIERNEETISNQRLVQWLLQAKKHGWSQSLKRASELKLARAKQLIALVESGTFDPTRMQWLRGTDIDPDKLSATGTVALLSFSTIKPIGVLRMIMNRVNLPNETFWAVLNRIEGREVDFRIESIARLWDPKTGDRIIRLVLDHVRTDTLNLLRKGQNEDVSRLAWEVVHSRTQILRDAAKPGVAPLPRMPWLVAEEMAKIDAAILRSTLIANRHVCPFEVTKCIIRYGAHDAVDRIKALVGSGSETFWARRIDEIIDCWESAEQRPVYEFLFSGPYSAARIRRAHVEGVARDPGAIMMTAAGRKNPVQLVSVMVAAGYPMQYKHRNSTTSAKYRCKLSTCPQTHLGATADRVHRMIMQNRTMTKETLDAAQGPIDQEPLSWLATVEPALIRPAIENGHRISKREFHATKAGLPEDTCALLRRAISPMLWRTTTHFLFPKSERDRIETIFTAASASALPTLPAEIWEMIIRFVYPSNGPIALGWA